MDLLSWLNPMISFIYLTEHILIYSYLINSYVGSSIFSLLFFISF